MFEPRTGSGSLRTRDLDPKAVLGPEALGVRTQNWFWVRTPCCSTEQGGDKNEPERANQRREAPGSSERSFAKRTSRR